VLIALAKALADAGNPNEAIRVYEQAERTEAGRSAEALIHRADLLARLNRTEAAAQLYARGARLAGDGEEAQWAWIQLARMRRLQHRYEDARAVLDEMAQRGGEDVLSRLSVAMKNDLPEEE
jgi:tetratricopeptide (TPR) repeat protein